MLTTRIAPTANVVAFLLKGNTVKTPKRPQPTVPAVGTSLRLKLDWVQFENEEGQARTPMAKIRFNLKTWEWEQVPLAEAGMLVFFTTAPDTFHHSFQIASIVPNGRAAYAEPE